MSDFVTGEATLVAALAGGQTVRAAAKAAGVSERTVHRRLNDHAFRREVSNMRRDALVQAAGRLAHAS